jgi:protein phosphatase
MHLGDSRAYLIRGQSAYQLTADHTWAQEAMDAGTISTEEAASHPGRNQLLRFLGASKGITVDRGLIEPDTGQREEYLLVEPGDAILLCTDGVHRYVTPAVICGTVQQHNGSPQAAVEELIEQAVANGARDDVTAVLLTGGCA